MIKKFVFTCLIASIINCSAFAETTTPASVNASFQGYQTQPNPVEYSSCMRNYQIPAKELFIRALSAISASNYKIIEIQSKSSRVLFSIWGKEFWANVTKQNSGASTLRILPTDNSYYFNKELIDKIFADIDNHKAEKIIQVNK